MTFKPTLEPLESRDVPTTAYLDAGVLHVDGTPGNERIAVNHGPESVEVVGVGTFDAADVERVVVNGRGGWDAVLYSYGVNYHGTSCNTLEPLDRGYELHRASMAW